MNSHVEVISKEIIKPSSQTPEDLKLSKLSFFDQLVPPVYVPIIFFYEADESRGLISSNHAQISQLLKKSLSEILTSFCQLAGRIRDNIVVECSDAGVEFIEARVHSRLLDCTNEPDIDVLKKYLPLDPVTAGYAGEGALLLVQVNYFDCGGIAVGVCVAHQMADGASVMAFVNAWAAAHRGEPGSPRRSIDISSFFPAMESSTAKTWKTSIPDDNSIVAKRFVFDKKKLSALKQAAVSPSGATVNDPSRVELISAFIWKHVSECRRRQQQRGKDFAGFHAVNLRKRAGPEYQDILENVFGNFVVAAFVFPAAEGAEELHELVGKFRSSIRSINAEAMAKAQAGDDSRIKEGYNLLTNEKLEWYHFTSWCGFPVYEVDFGWGKAGWVCTPRWPVKNAIVFLSSRNGEDVEIWVNMERGIMEILETQFKLIE